MRLVDDLQNDMLMHLSLQGKQVRDSEMTITFQLQETIIVRLQGSRQINRLVIYQAGLMTTL
jgi:hypothetical protein